LFKTNNSRDLDRTEKQLKTSCSIHCCEKMRMRSNSD
jgi:hypothetical protein